MKRVLISIVIAAFNEERKIVKCLDSLLNQKYKNIEIIVVDDGSTDRTVKTIGEYIKKYKNVFLLQQKRQGPGAAKNLAAKTAKGEILVFVDADEYPRKDYVEKLTKPIREGKAKTAIGAWVVAKPENPWARCRFKDTYELRRHALESGVFRAVRKSSFKKFGGFDTTKGYSDDRIKTGLKRARIDSAVFDHDVDSDIGEIYRKRKWIGSSILSNPKNIKFKIKILAGTILVILLAIFLFILPIVSLIILIICLLPLIYKTLSKVFFYKDPRLLFYYPIYSVVCGLGMLKGLLVPEYKKEVLS